MRQQAKLHRTSRSIIYELTRYRYRGPPCSKSKFQIRSDYSRASSRRARPFPPPVSPGGSLCEINAGAHDKVELAVDS
jgi:hypothetical protein